MTRGRAPNALRLLGLALACAAAALCAAPSDASAELRRYAVVVGANLGEPDEEPLRYAERDAERVADVLRRLGRFPVEDTVVLLGADADTAERVLGEVNRRIERARAEHPDDEHLLLVFYSGHADAGGMHLGGTRLPFGRVRAHLKSSPANLRVFIIDACRSGAVTRVKGGRPIKPFKIALDQKLTGEGMAIITSSAQGEDAQESNRLQGGFFTHHLVSGLLGAADASGDSRVSLREAYDYAYTETLRSTSRSRFIQHPTYAFQMKGRQDLVLTHLNTDHAQTGRLKLADKGTYVLFKGDEDGPVAGEFTVSRPAEVVLEPGAYHVLHRAGRTIHEGPTRVKAKSVTAVPVSSLDRVPYAQLVRKGLKDAPSRAWAATLSGGVLTPLTEDTDPAPVGALGLRLDMELLALHLRARYSQGATSNDFVRVDQTVLGMDVSLLKLFDLSDFSLGFGLRIGADRVTQTFTTPGVAPDRVAWIGHIGAVLHAAYTPTPWLSIFVEGDGDIALIPTETTDLGLASLQPDNLTSVEPRVTPQLAAGIALYLF